MISKVWHVIIYYILAMIAGAVARMIAPTDMAGPGLDLLVFGLVTLFSCFQTVGSAIKAYTVGQPFKYIFLVHILGWASVVTVMNLVG